MQICHAYTFSDFQQLHTLTCSIVMLRSIILPSLLALVEPEILTVYIPIVNTVTLTIVTKISPSTNILKGKTKVWG